MALVGAVSFFLFIAASGVIGVRLLLLARRTGELPEFTMALAHLLGGFAGYGSSVAARVLHLVPASWAPGVLLWSVLCMSAAAFSIAVFTHSVFRPEARWGAAILAVLLALFAAGIIGAALDVSSIRTGVGRLSFWGITLGTGIAYGWATTESLLYRARLLKRARLGLGDPLVANRLLLWATTEAGATLISVLYAALRLLDLPDDTQGVASAASCLVLVCAVASWLAFFPPAAYRRWVTGEPERDLAAASS